MKLKVLSKYIFIVGSLLMIAGCSFLDETSQDELKPSTVDDFDKVLISNGYANNLNNFMPYHDLLTDDVESFEPSFPEDPGEVQSIKLCMPFYQWDSHMFDEAQNNQFEGYNSWEALYQMIKNCNVVLQSIDDAAGSVEAREYLRAQALVLRAYYYFMLVNIYCDPYCSGDPATIQGVPLITRFNVTEAFPKRSSLKDVYDMILRETLQAIDLFEKYTPERHAVNRASDRMAHTLAARIYQQMHNWEEVVKHSTKTLEKQSDLIKLSDHISKWGDYDYDYRPYNWNARSGYQSVEYIWGCCRFSLLTTNIFTSLTTFQKPQYRAFEVSKSLVNLYEYQKEGSTHIGDVRYIAFYILRQDPAYVKMPYYGSKGNDTQTGATVFGMRTAEVYLNRAEANIRLLLEGKGGDRTQAINDLNTLRESRWNTNASPYVDFRENPRYRDLVKTDEGLLEFCLEERRRELAFEMIRWFDLRRYGRPRLVHTVRMSGTTTEVVLEENDPRYTLPIPQVVLDRNPNL